jgi:hypothetical protein
MPEGLSGIAAWPNRQAFWLTDHSTGRAFPGPIRGISLIKPSGFNRMVCEPRYPVAAFVPEHSNGWFAMDFYHLSF